MEATRTNNEANGIKGLPGIVWRLWGHPLPIALTWVPDERSPHFIPAGKHLQDAARHQGLQHLPD